MVAEGFGTGDRRVILILMFNSLAPTSYSTTSLPQCYRWAKLEKKRMHEKRIQEIEHGSFMPLAFPIPEAWVSGNTELCIKMLQT